VVFFKTVAPVEPVSFVQKICEDAMANPMHKRTRTAKRLAPMTLMGKATMEGLESVAKDVLAPHFHQAPVTPKRVSSDMSLGRDHMRGRRLTRLACSSVSGLTCETTTL
jgi:tRNA acetyltransferase TAN1